LLGSWAGAQLSLVENETACNRIAMSTNPKTASYGCWQSPITSDLIVTQSISLSEVRFDGQTIYWLEARPQEQGRNVVVRAGGPGASTTDIVPKPFNVRTRVHEYGGGAWTVALGVLYFSNFADGRLYRLGPGESDPAPLTPAPLTRDRHWRFADGVIDHGHHRWIGVREDHTRLSQPVNAIVALDLAQSGTAAGHIIAADHDFVASPRLSPDGRCLAWLAWDHPNMPWNGTPLYLAALDADGAIIGSAQRIAGGAAESIFQPEWSPDGTDLLFVSDRSGWWNLYRFTLATGAVLSIAPQTVEFGQPQLNFGMATYAFAGPDRIVCTYSEAGLGHLAVIDLTTGSLRPLDTPFTQFASLRAHGDQVAFIAGAPSHPASVNGIACMRCVSACRNSTRGTRANKRPKTGRPLSRETTCGAPKLTVQAGAQTGLSATDRRPVLRVRGHIRQIGRLSSVQSELAVDRADLRRLDQPRMCHGDRVQWAFQGLQPEIEEFVERRKCWTEIVILPDITLQQPRVIRPPVENVGSGQPIALKLRAKVLRNHFGLHPITGNVLLTRSSMQVSKLKNQPLAPPIPAPPIPLR
jgi:hypothetical protein